MLAQFLPERIQRRAALGHDVERAEEAAPVLIIATRDVRRLLPLRVGQRDAGCAEALLEAAVVFAHRVCQRFLFLEGGLRLFERLATPRAPLEYLRAFGGLHLALGFSHFSLRLGNLALRVCVGVVNGLLALLLLPGFFLGVGLLFSTDLSDQRRAAAAQLFKGG